MESSILNLPRDCKYNILIKLQISDLLSLCLTNKSLIYILNDDIFWNRKTYHDYPQYYNAKIENQTFKHWYQQLRFDNVIFYNDWQPIRVPSYVRQIISNDKLYIDIYNQTWLGRWNNEDNIILSRKDKVPFLASDDIKSTSVGNNYILILECNDELYMLFDNQKIFVHSRVKNIGSGINIAYFITKDNDLYLLSPTKGWIFFRCNLVII